MINLKEVCQTFTVASLANTTSSYIKIKQLVIDLLKNCDELRLLASGRTFYELCLLEACVQVCSSRPTLLTRPKDFVIHGRKVLQNCKIIENENISIFENKKR
jgi:hypothetical protein